MKTLSWKNTLKIRKEDEWGRMKFEISKHGSKGISEKGDKNSK